MTPRELRKLIGKTIEWDYAIDSYRGFCLTRQGRVVEVVGKNVYMDCNGSMDWKWIPGMHNVRVVEDK